MSTELDPMFVRALHLLHSKHPKALEQLCALRDEVLGKKPDSPVEVHVTYIYSMYMLQNVDETTKQYILFLL